MDSAEQRREHAMKAARARWTGMAGAPSRAELVRRKRRNARRRRARGVLPPPLTPVEAGRRAQKKRLARKRVLREAIFDVLGRYCAVCGFSDMRALQVDHVYEDGARDPRRDSANEGYYAAIYASVQRQEGRFQILCANCNWIKSAARRERGRGHREPPARGPSAGQLPLQYEDCP